LQTNNYGAVIQHIEPEHMKDIPVPDPPDAIKSKINDLVMRSHDLRDESNDMIDKSDGPARVRAEAAADR
jgi:type I restriction enzyme S subunit